MDYFTRIVACCGLRNSWTARSRYIIKLIRNMDVNLNETWIHQYHR